MKAKHKRIFRLSSILLVLGLFAMLLTGCTRNEQKEREKIQGALDAIKLVYVSGDSEESVSNDVELPDKSKRLEVEWLLNNKDIADIKNGVLVVTRPENDTVIYLTAKISNKGVTLYRSFNLTIKGTKEPTKPEPSDGVKTYPVVFYAGSNKIGETQYVEYGQAAVAPTPPEIEGYYFVEWDIDFDNITVGLKVTAIYAVKTYEVKFFEDGVQVGETLTLNHGTIATPPEVIRRKEDANYKYIFKDWDKPLDPVTEDMEYHAEYYQIDGKYQFTDDSDYQVYGNRFNSYIGTEEYIIVPEYVHGVLFTKTGNAYFDGLLSNNSTVKGVAFEVPKNVTSTFAMFAKSEVLEIELDYLDTSYVTDMSSMFHDSKATSITFGGLFNTSNVTTMKSMFATSKVEELDLSVFDTSNVVDMSGMFQSSRVENLNLTGFDTSNVVDMSSMFQSSRVENLDLTPFDTSNVTTMRNMFILFKGDTIDFSSFNTSNVTNMSGMFASASALTALDLSSFDTSNVTNMSNMFRSASAVATIDLSSFDTSNVESMSDMFLGTDSLTLGYARNQEEIDKFHDESLTGLVNKVFETK